MFKTKLVSFITNIKIKYNFNGTKSQKEVKGKDKIVIVSHSP
jgi:hypothetical protein